MKTCKNFCEKVFLPERERVEIQASKNSKVKYIPLNVLRKTNKSLARRLKKMYIKTCDDIYCQKKCTGKPRWNKSFTKKRKIQLIKQGAKSGCRDLVKEFPEYYKNI